MSGGEELYEMVGTLVAWDGKQGYLLTDEGERLDIDAAGFYLLRPYGSLDRKSFPLAVGCRVHCIVSVRVDYRLQKIRAVVPHAAGKEEIARLKERARARGGVLFYETFTGTLVSIDRRKQEGVIRRDDDGAAIEFLSPSGIKKGQRLVPGMWVRCDAFRANERWFVSCIHVGKKP